MNIRASFALTFSLLLLLFFSPVYAEPGDVARLFQAIASNDPEKARRLLDAGVPADARHKIGLTVLMAAASSRQNTTPIIRLLLARGAAVNAQDKEGNSALHMACENHPALTAIEALLANGANPNLRNKSGYTPGHLLIEKRDRPDMLAALVDRGADPELPAGYYKDNLLHTALKAGRTESVKTLLKKGANIEAHNDRNKTPLHTAVNLGRYDRGSSKKKALVALLLKAGADPNADSGWILKSAVGYATIEIQKMLLRGGADPTLSPEKKLPFENATSAEERIMHSYAAGRPDVQRKAIVELAVENNNLYTLKKMLEAGVDPNLALGRLPQTPLMKALRNKNDTIVRALLKHGADPNIRDYNGCTALFHAKSATTYRLLLEHRANPTAACKDGRTPLMEAVRGGYTAIVRSFLKQGQNPDARNKKGQTALFWARDSAIIHALQKAGGDINARDKRGRTPLHSAVDLFQYEHNRRSNPDWISNLLHAGADPTIRDNDGRTALDIFRKEKIPDPLTHRWLASRSFTESLIDKTNQSGKEEVVQARKVSWEYYPIQGSRGINALYFRDQQHGWVLGRWSQIKQTRDGGRTWTAINNPFPAGFSPESIFGRTANDIFFQDDRNGWIVGDNGYVLRTRDGKTWKSMRVGTTALNAIHFTGPRRGFIAGAYGKVWRTLDGGKTWTPLKTPAVESIYDIFFVDRRNGWMAGYNTMLRTTDGGQTWQSHPVKAIRRFKAIHFSDPLNGWGVGMAGSYINPKTAVVRTTDGGRTWSRVPMPPEFLNFYDVHFHNEREGWVVGTEGAILKTGDGGKTWIRFVPEQDQGNWNSIFFLDEKTGWIADRDGKGVLKIGPEGLRP